MLYTVYHMCSVYVPGDRSIYRPYIIIKLRLSLNINVLEHMLRFVGNLTIAISIFSDFGIYKADATLPSSSSFVICTFYMESNAL